MNGRPKGHNASVRTRKGHEMRFAATGQMQYTLHDRHGGQWEGSVQLPYEEVVADSEADARDNYVAIAQQSGALHLPGDLLEGERIEVTSIDAVVVALAPAETLPVTEAIPA